MDPLCSSDPRCILIRAEWLSPRGLGEVGRSVLEEYGWGVDRTELFSESFRLYWTRTAALSHRTGDLAPPRLRNVAVIEAPETVRPFSQILNASTWTLYEADLDPSVSDPEFVAYLLLHGDRAAQTGEVTLVAVHLAAWWFERSEAERSRFADAAAASTRPDADVHRAIADATHWLRGLRHVRMRPPRSPASHRPVQGTGLLVPRAVEREPEELVARCRSAATAALRGFQERHRSTAAGAPPVRNLLDWLTADPRSVLVTGRGNTTIWDPAAPEMTVQLEESLAGVGREIAEDILADLRVLEEHTRRFLASVVKPDALPAPDPDAAQGGYTYMHAERRLLAYNLDEPGIERLLAPAIPYARAMLGARAFHEWSHLAVDAGWVPRHVEDSAWSQLVTDFADGLDRAIAKAPKRPREIASAALASLPGSGSPGRRLSAAFVSRIPDFQSNLLASHYWSDLEREVYVRQNVRPLRSEYGAAQAWSMLVRYLYEYQYLAFSDVPDPRTYFLGSTWFDDDFLAPGLLTEDRLDDLLSGAARLCRAHRVDSGRFCFP